VATRKQTLRTCPKGHRYNKSSDCPVCPVCAAAAKEKLAGDEIPRAIAAPALRALDREGIRTLAQLAQRSQADVAALHGVGPKAIRLLGDAMAARGLAFKKS